ncbi:winged helix-turn-helix DNA-binding family protein [Burkholderia pseudomallei MSHR983]|nr:winged helix-turn-helix DNA-binding family protein [Burkholderia pseudomallei MSHR983]
MAYPTLTMRKIREVLRQHFDCGFRQREIARAVVASPTTVGQYVRRMERAGLSWEVSATLSDDELEARLYPPPPRVEGRRPKPHWPTVRCELSRKAYRTCPGVLRLAKDYGNERLEAACCRAIDLKAPGYKFIASTLKNGLDQQPSPTSVQIDLPLTHANVREPNYYH